jgi:ankyrin repeat protein
MKTKGRKNSSNEDLTNMTAQDIGRWLEDNAINPSWRLFGAAVRGDAEEVIEILSSGVNPNIQFKLGLTPLNGVAMGGSPEVCRVLLQAGAKVNGSGTSETPLVTASARGHTDVVEVLLEAGADVNLSRKNQMTPLESACVGGYTKIVDLLLRAGARPLRSSKGVVAHMPLILAVQNGHKDVVELLIENGEGLDPEGKQIASAIHMAVATGRRELAKILIKRGAPKELSGLNPSLWLAASLSQSEVVRLLVEKGVDVNADYQGITPLLLASESGNTELVEFLVLNGADINVVTEGSPNSPLLAACMKNRVELARILLENGADPDLHHPDGPTPIVAAVMERNHEVMKLLIKFGANVNLATARFSGPLQCAVSVNDLESVERLLKAKANPNARLPDGGRLLHMAMDSGQAEAAAALIRYGAIDPRDDARREKAWQDYKGRELFDAIDSGKVAEVLDAAKDGADLSSVRPNGDTPLMAAIDNGHEEIVKILLDQGCNPDTRNLLNGETALIRAIRERNLALAAVILTAGADINGRNNEGETALMIAVNQGDAEAVGFLVEKGCDVNASDSVSSETTATRAFRGNHMEILEVLLKKGALLNLELLIAAAKNGNTKMVNKLMGWGCNASEEALLAACQEGHGHLVKLMIQRGASPNAYDSRTNNPAIIIAAKRGDIKTLRELVNGGAKVNAKGHNETTALMEAAKQGDFQMAKFLLSKGADPQMQDGKGRTALDYARQTGEFAQFEDLNARLAEFSTSSPAAKEKTLSKLKNKDLAQVRQVIELLESSGIR